MALNLSYDTPLDILGTIAECCSSALQYGLPLQIELSAFHEDLGQMQEVSLALAALGASALIVNPQHVAKLKQWMSQSDMNEVRERLFAAIR